MSEILLREDTGALCTLTLNRPEQLNALNTELFQRLDEELAALETQTETIGCVVLRAAGRYFCAGADLKAIAGGITVPPGFKPGVIERLSRLPQPVIARIHAPCVTGGLELVLAADFIVASTAARFADTHGRWGFVGGWGMSQRLPRRVGVAYAKLLMMTGRSIDAEEAMRVGLVDVCVTEDTLDAAVATLAQQLLANSWHTNRGTKRLLLETDGLPLAAGLAHEQRHHPGPAPDYRERVRRFSDDR